MAGTVVDVKSVKDWDKTLDDAARNKKVIVVDFTAAWCGPCKEMSPIFTRLATEHKNLIFLRVDVDELQEVAEKWDVQAMPTFIFIREKRLVHKIVGANKSELESKSKSFAAQV